MTFFEMIKLDVDRQLVQYGGVFKGYRYELPVDQNQLEALAQSYEINGWEAIISQATAIVYVNIHRTLWYAN